MSDIFDLFKKLFPSTDAPAGEMEYIIAGLGNPGRKYENSRHNAGWMTIDYLAEKMGVKVDRIKFKSTCGDGTLAGKRVLLLKPQTFMNRSGEAVVEAMGFYKIPPERVIVLFDDISLPPGKIRIRRKGSDGGHNGMKNIIYLSGKDAFPRVKIGVGAKPGPEWDLADWVLSSFSDAEAKEMGGAIENAYRALELMVRGDIDGAMGQYNGQ